MSEKKIVIERTLKAPIEKVWKMWTTKEGIESWWGPEGFRSTVTHLDVRIGGRFELVMTAFVPQIVAYLKSQNMPESRVSKGDYVEVVENARLAYANLVDFVPGVAAYTTTTTVELSVDPSGTRLVVTNDAMHDEHWTKMATMGWDSQLAKLATELA